MLDIRGCSTSGRILLTIRKLFNKTECSIKGKSLENLHLQGFRSGDKEDRTPVLLNGIISQTNGSPIFK